MRPNISRREILKLSQLLPLVYFSSPVKRLNPLQDVENDQNILILLFDTLSARHVQLYGYSRETMPRLPKFAEGATVFHNHYSAGNFTTSGTASLLTGTMPWAHRAFDFQGIVSPEFETKNIFSLFDTYYRTAYSHNPLATGILKQFLPDIDHYKPRQELYLDKQIIFNEVFGNDYDIATLSWVRIIKELEGSFSNSLFLSRFYKSYKDRQISYLKDLYPRGIPGIQKDNYFFLDEAIDWSMDWVTRISQPFLAYFHYFPPHPPLSTRREFVDIFAGDGYQPVSKKGFFQIENKKDKTEDEIQILRQWYDEYILFVDSELDRLISHLENEGVLENTWVIVTSDHGELFERGFVGHIEAALYQGVVKVPLIIKGPGQTSRVDVFENTSSIDVLPTLLHLTGRPIPSWVGGQALPPYAQDEYDPERSIYSFDARASEKYGPTTVATISLTKGRYKMIYYIGYENLVDGAPVVELFDLENDSEEVYDLHNSQITIAESMLSEIKEKLNEINRPYPA